MKSNIFTTKLLDIRLSSKTDSFEDANGIFIIMDFFPHDVRNVLEKVDKDSLTIDHVTVILYNSLCAINYLHSAGLMHRDVKPSNILLNEECSVSFCDFG